MIDNSFDSETFIKYHTDNFITIYKPFVIFFGPDGALYLNELILYHSQLKQNRLLEKDGSFSFKSEMIQNRVGLDKFQQSGVLKKFRELEIITTILKGVPPKNYFKIHFDKIKNFFVFSNENTEESPPIQIIDEFNHPPLLPPLKEKDKDSITLKDLKKDLVNTTEDRKEYSREYSFLSLPTYLLDKRILEKAPKSSEKEDERKEKNQGFGFPIELKIRKDKSPIEFEKPTYENIRKDVLDIINYWNNSPGLPHHRLPPIVNGQKIKPTKLISEVITILEKIIRGTYYDFLGKTEFLRPFSKDEILLVIDKYKLAATNPQYHPARKSYFKNIGLREFFFTPFSEKHSSCFLQYLTEEPKIIKSFIKKESEKNLQLTIWLKEIYTKKVLMRTENQFSELENEKFIRGSNFLHEAIGRFHKRLNMLTRPIEYCEMVIDALIDTWPNQIILPGHVASEYTYSIILPQYLKKKGRID